MKRLFRKIRSVYRKNPPAYLSLAVIAISLTIGTSVSNLGLIPQILRIGGRDRNCARFTKASDCQSTPSCSWIPEGETKCSFNASGQCPEDCKYSPGETIECSSLNQIGCIDTEGCQWQQQTSKRVCNTKTVTKNCSFSDGNCRQNSCNRVSPQAAVYGCNCSVFSNSQTLCEANDCNWILVKPAVSASCTGKYTKEVEDCRRQTVAAQCTGGTQQINKGKCEGVYYPNGKCVSSSTTPSPSPSSSCDLPCQAFILEGKCIINDEGQPTCIDREGEPTTVGSPCDPSKNTVGSDGLLYSECSPDDPHYFCAQTGPKAGYCQRRDDHPYPYNPRSECNPFAQLYGSDSPTKRCYSTAYDCVLKPGTDDFYICLSSYGANQCDPNNLITHPAGPAWGTINADCYARHRDENMVCVQLPKPNDRLYTCQSSTSDETLKPCYYEYDKKWYTHGSTITEQGETCNYVNGLPTGFEVRSQLCSNGEWKDKDVTYVDSAYCPQVASCKMYDLNDPAQQKLFKEGDLHCCGKVVNYLDTKNNYGQTYKDYYNAICKPKEESQTSFWESLKEIF